MGSVVPYMLQTPDNPDGVAHATFDGMREAMEQDRAAFWTTFFQQVYGIGFVKQPVSDEVVDWSRTIAMQASLKATLACAQAFATTDFRGDLASFRVPTLILHGTADKTVPIDATGRKAAAGIAGSTLIEYDGAPHGLLASGSRHGYGHRGALLDDAAAQNGGIDDAMTKTITRRGRRA
jgi:non-heme chloroperoxidase